MRIFKSIGATALLIMLGIVLVILIYISYILAILLASILICYFIYTVLKAKEENTFNI